MGPLAGRLKTMNNVYETPLAETVVEGVREPGVVVPMQHGRWLEVHAEPDGDRVTVRSGGGFIELEIKADGAGVRARVRAVSLDLEAAESITARCDHYRVEARESVSIQGATVAVEALRGDATVKANDRVRLDGEQVLLNCDDPEPVPAWMATRLGASLVEVGPSKPRGSATER